MIRTSVLALILLAGCTTEDSVERERDYAERYAHFERVGAWVITCTDYLHRDDGTIRPYNACSLRRSLVRGTLEGGNALVVTAVDGREGIVAPRGDQRCRVQPRTRMVDAASIRDWPMWRQLAMLESGRRYREEFMPRKWPECWIVLRDASLDGYGRAHRRFQEVARARGALW